MYAPTGLSIIKSGNSVMYKNTTSTEYKYNKGDVLYDSINGGEFECTNSIRLYSRVTTYRVTTAFKYLRTHITKPVSLGVTDLTLKRNSGYNFSLSWKNPSDLGSSDRCDRAEVFYIYITLKYGGNTVESNYFFEYSMITSWSKTIFKTNNSSSDYVWDRKDFYPYGSRRIDEISFRVVPKNISHGCEAHVPRSISYRFASPKAPEVTGTYKVDESAKTISQSFSSPIDMNSEYDKVYTSTFNYLYDSRTNKSTETSQTQRTESNFTLTQVIPDIYTFGPDDYVTVGFYETSRGIAGVFTESQSFNVSYPSKPNVSLASISDDWYYGNATFNIYVGKDPGYKVTNVKLQVLSSTTYMNASEIPKTAPWTDVGPTEIASCKAIALGISSILPYAGTTTWIRVKSWNKFENIFFRFSDPIRITQLETPAPPVPSPDDDMAEVLSHVVNTDGTSVELLIGWDLDGKDDSSETEISWDTSEKAWRSNKPPTTFTIDDETWDEGAVTVGGKTYNKSTRVTINGLEQETRYYFSCRRILTLDKSKSYGPYSEKYIINTSDISALPQSLVVYADSSTIAGEPIQVSWGYNSPLSQSSWMIKKAVSKNGYSEDDTVLAMENDSRRNYKLPYYRDARNMFPIVDDDATEVYLYVVISVSSVTLTSEIIKIDILKRPYFSISAPNTTIVQPVTLAVFSNNKNTTVSAFIEANEIISDGPDGKIKQSDGDTIWSGTIAPEWELVDEYASRPDVSSAKEALDNAQRAYDEVIEQYRNALSRKDEAQSEIEILTTDISNTQRDIPTAQATLQDAQDRLDGVGEDDPMYGLYTTQLQMAYEALQALQAKLQESTQRLPVAQSDLQNAQDEIESIDTSDEEAALQSAINEYALVETGSIDPTSNEFAYRATITLPPELNLIDGARYPVRGFATDTQSGINSTIETTNINIAWAHQAPIPSEDITIEPIDQTDEAGNRTIGTKIHLKRPVNAFNDDVYDVYRVTSGGALLAVENAPLDGTLIDNYAMFSGEQMYYRIVCRTSDGDVTWKDYSYVLHESTNWYRVSMRIDWSGNYVELERNVAPSESYEKPFVAHTHLDGSVSGHWNVGTNRTMSVQAALVRTYDNRQRIAVEELARYNGPCYVRTNDGAAFECNVQVDSISLNRNSVRVDLSLSMTEIEPTGAFSMTVEE